MNNLSSAPIMRPPRNFLDIATIEVVSMPAVGVEVCGGSVGEDGMPLLVSNSLTTVLLLVVRKTPRQSAVITIFPSFSVPPILEAQTSNWPPVGELRNNGRMIAVETKPASNSSWRCAPQVFLDLPSVFHSLVTATRAMKVTSRSRELARYPEFEVTTNATMELRVGAAN